MELTRDDCSRVTEGLTIMADLFRDPLSEAQIESYWTILQPELSLDEWDYAFNAALKRTTFPRVPLPGVLIKYGLQYRAMATAVENAMHADRRSTRLLTARDTSLDLMSRAEVRAIIDRIWPSEIIPSMPAPIASECEDDYGRVIYLSGRTARQEAERKELLRAQVQRSIAPAQEGEPGAY